MPLATEGVILGAMLLGHVAVVPAIFGGNVSTAGLAEGREQTDITTKIAPFKEKWVYTAPENFLGMFASSPVVDGSRRFRRLFRCLAAGYARAARSPYRRPEMGVLRKKTRPAANDLDAVPRRRQTLLRRGFSRR